MSKKVNAVWALCSEYWRKKVPVCEVCRQRASSEVHHIVPRRNHALIFDRENLIVICHVCHNKLHPKTKLQPCFDDTERYEIITRLKGEGIFDYLAQGKVLIKKYRQTELDDIRIYFRQGLKEL